MSQAGHVGKLVACNPPPPVAVRSGALAITGGTGGLGAAMARWAVERQLAGALTLLGRSGRTAAPAPPAEACAVLLARCGRPASPGTVPGRRR